MAALHPLFTTSRKHPLPSVCSFEMMDRDFSNADLSEMIKQASKASVKDRVNWHRRRSRSALDARTAKRIIVPSRDSLMKQISGLTVDDPFLRKKATISSGLSNSYVNPIDENSRTEVSSVGAESVLEDDLSIASDPTATYGKGVNLNEFEKSLSHFEGFLSSATKRELEAVPSHKARNIADRLGQSHQALGMSSSKFLDFNVSFASLDLEDVLETADNSAPLVSETKTFDTTTSQPLPPIPTLPLGMPPKDPKGNHKIQRSQSSDYPKVSEKLVSPRRSKSTTTKALMSSPYKSPTALRKGKCQPLGNVNRVYDTIPRELPNMTALFPE